MFQSQFNRVFINFRKLGDFIAFTGKYRFHKLKMRRRKLRYENRMGFLHLGSKDRNFFRYRFFRFFLFLLAIFQRSQ